MDTRHFHEALFTSTRRLVPPGEAILCAVSGGADSMALFHGLHRVNSLRKCGWRLHVAHLDHHLPQGESANMAAFVRDHAQRLHVPIYEESIDVPALARETGESIEESGRKARFVFLQRAADHFNCSFVALAHQADDQAETVLHRVLRGTSLAGLAGIPERRRLELDRDIWIVRPMLDFTRTQITAYLRRRGVSWMHDATNDDVDVATRNFIRHELLPLIRSRVNPSATTALRRLAQSARHASEHLADAGRSLLQEATDSANDHEIRMDALALASAPAAVRAEAFKAALHQLSAPMKSIGRERLEALCDAVSEDVNYRMVELTAGFHAERKGKVFIIRKPVVNAGPITSDAWATGASRA